MQGRALVCLVLAVVGELAAAFAPRHDTTLGVEPRGGGAAALAYGGRIFLSNASLHFDASGIAAADALCEAEGTAFDPSSSGWAALLVDEDACTAKDDKSVRLPCRRATGIPNKGDAQLDWVLQPSATYYQLDNTTVIGHTDESGLLQFPLQSEIAGCSNQFSGMARDWTTRAQGTCHNWQEETKDAMAGVGYSCELGDGLLDGGHVDCLSGAERVICVGPAAHRVTDPICVPYGECTTGSSCAKLDYFNATEVVCNCSCGCVFEKAKQGDREGRWREEGGAAVVVDSQTMEIVPEVKRGMRLAFESSADNGKCECRSNGGTPACQTMYPAPSNSSIYDFARSDKVTDDTRVVFFGDSITWLGGYMALFADALAQEGKNATLINRGINGGKVLDTRDGRGDTPSFVDCLDEDKPTMINIMIGINDVWFAGASGSSNVTTFTSVLEGLVHTALERRIKVALATVSVIGEKTDFTNGHDGLLIQFATATRVVAQATGASLADVHQGYLDYEATNNVFPPGEGISNGLLTIDGVHPCMGGFNDCPNYTHGNYMLGGLIAGALLHAAEN